MLISGNILRVPDIFNIEYTTSMAIANYRVLMSIAFKRLNDNGYGFSYVRRPTLQLYLEFDNETDSLFGYHTKDKDVWKFAIDLQANNIKALRYGVVDTYQSDLIAGSIVVADKTVDFKLMLTERKYIIFQKDIYNYSINGTVFSGYVYQDMNDFGFMFPNSDSITGRAFSASGYLTNARNYIKKFIVAGVAAGQTNPLSYTYYQYQYAIMTKGTGRGNDGIVYLTPNEAEMYCKTNYEWCQNGGDAAE